jgi:ribosome biogenesis GTPase
VARAILNYILTMTRLEQFGWHHYIHRGHQAGSAEEKTARVISLKGIKYHLATEAGELEAELAGKLMYGQEPDQLPKVGDWVQYLDYDNMGYIVKCWPRVNELARKQPGNATARQVLAANIDCALVVQGLDRDFNLMRLERYLAQLAACQVPAVVVLNKADLVENWQTLAADVRQLQRQAIIYFCSTVTGIGVQALLEDVLLPERTFVLIGSSGVGKSSLLNCLLQTDQQAVQTLSEAHAKGRHTTTARELFRLPNGSLLIDTPGMREFGLTFEGDSGADLLFPAIDALAKQCRFNDCQHMHEAGCAVVEAVGQGRLSTTSYESYLKLMRERSRFEVRAEDRKRMGKLFGRISKEAKAYRKKYKY